MERERLINADVFEKFIKEKYADGEKAEDIKEQMLFDLSCQPTVYDVDAVVERLEKEKQTSTSAKAEAIIGMCGASANHYGGEECAYQRAIEIVKGGVVDDSQA